MPASASQAPVATRLSMSARDLNVDQLDCVRGICVAIAFGSVAWSALIWLVLKVLS